MIISQAADAAATSIDPLAVVIISATGGAIVTALFALIGAAVSARREHTKWLREQRFEAYQRALRLIEHMRYLNDDRRQWKEMTDLPADMPKDERARLESALGKMVGEDGTAAGQWRRGREIREERVEAHAVLSIVGPPRVYFALDVAMAALTDGDSKGHREAVVQLNQEINKALKIKD